LALKRSIAVHTSRETVIWFLGLSRYMSWNFHGSCAFSDLSKVSRAGPGPSKNCYERKLNLDHSNCKTRGRVQFPNQKINIGFNTVLDSGSAFLPSALAYRCQ